jgi:hypothetical protein
MFDYIKNWTKEEFKVYLFIYCAKANFKEDDEERNLIKAQYAGNNYDEIHREIDSDSDYQRIQKILVNFKKFYSTEEQLNELCEELQSVLMADGKIDILEENLFRALKHQLSQQ